jgi:hypothetical protein
MADIPRLRRTANPDTDTRDGADIWRYEWADDPPHSQRFIRIALLHRTDGRGLAAHTGRPAADLIVRAHPDTVPFVEWIVADDGSYVVPDADPEDAAAYRLDAPL